MTMPSPVTYRGVPVTKIVERIAFGGLLIVVCLSAIPFGTVDTFSKSLLVVCICVIALVRAIQGAVERSFRISEPFLFLPLVGILLLAIIQTLPLPFVGGKPISSDPFETKIFVVTFAGLLIAGEVLFYYTNSGQRLKALISVIVLIATVSALFGIVRTLMLKDETSAIEVYFPTISQGYAQFINRNHFVVLMEMALGLTFGLLLKGKLANKFKFFGLVLSALFIYSAIAANSRGGLISLAALLLFGAFVQIMTRRSSTETKWPRTKRTLGSGTVLGKVILATALSCLIFGMFALTVVFVGGDAVVGRLEKLPGEFQTADENTMNRLAIWKSTALLIEDHPVFGVGFGAYPIAITRYDRSNGKWTLQQAHNEYLEILAGGGLIALTLFSIFAVIVVCKALHNFRSDNAVVSSSCFGALIGIFGVMIHSVVDFGLHIMVNALIFVFLIVIATARVDRSAKLESSDIYG
jgi:O-antigen ligase